MGTVLIIAGIIAGIIDVASGQAPPATIDQTGRGDFTTTAQIVQGQADAGKELVTGQCTGLQCRVTAHGLSGHGTAATITLPDGTDVSASISGGNVEVPFDATPFVTDTSGTSYFQVQVEGSYSYSHGVNAVAARTGGTLDFAVSNKNTVALFTPAGPARINITNTTTVDVVMHAWVTAYLCSTHDQEQPCNHVKDATEAMTSGQHLALLVQSPTGASYCARAGHGSFSVGTSNNPDVIEFPFYSETSGPDSELSPAVSATTIQGAVYSAQLIHLAPLAIGWSAEDGAPSSPPS